MISINYNPSVLKAQNNLSKANNAMSTALHRMSTGYKINCAADDAAGLYIATGLNTQIRGLKQAQKNVSDGKNILSIAEGSLSNISNMLNRVRDLALQGANSYYAIDSRNALQGEADKLLEEITRVKLGTNFNGMNLFEGSLQSGADSGISAFSPPPPTGRSASVERVSTDVIPEGYTGIYANTVEDLLYQISNDLEGKYILMNDIDCQYINDPDISYRIGEFKGVLDGNGHIIKNYSSMFGGLFDKTDGAEIKNLGLENIRYNNTYSSMGGLIGTAKNTTITNCFVTGSITGMGSDNLGGLIGEAKSTVNINNCYTEVNITNGSQVGGMVGLHETGSSSDSINIENSYTNGVISGSVSGGFIGSAYKGITINHCYTNANVQVSSNYNGMIVGFANIASKCKLTSVYYNYENEGKTTGINNNSISLPPQQFYNPEYWQQKNFDSDIWDLSQAPPKIKNRPGFYTPPQIEPEEPDNQDKQGTQGANGNIRLQVGANSDADANAIYVDISFSLEDLVVDFSDAESSIKAVEAVDNLLKQINDKMAYIGATQNRLDSVLESQTTQIENFTAAKSTIMDADIAEESAEFTKQQILTQSTAALLVQANRLNANVAMNLINSLM